MSAYAERMEAALLKQIRVELTECGLGQKELAEKMGLDRGSLNRYLTGATRMPTSIFYRIAEGLGIGSGELMVRAENRAGAADVSR